MLSPKLQEQFEQLVEAIRSEAREEMLARLNGEPLPAVNRKAAPRASAPRPRPKGAKRDASDIEALTNSILSYVRKNPGQRSEQIAAGINVTTKDLVLPVKKLITSKQLKTQGQKRGTTYQVK